MTIHKVVKKQNIGKMCFVCGYNNKLGLESNFYELDNDELVCICTLKEGHQSFPGRVHGGVSAALLDETIGRAITIKSPDVWGVTVELNTKYRKRVPIGSDVKIVARITSENKRMFEGTGEIILPTGEIAVTAWGKYLKVPLEKIIDQEFGEDEFVDCEREDDPKEFEF